MPTINIWIGFLLLQLLLPVSLNPIGRKHCKFRARKRPDTASLKRQNTWERSGGFEGDIILMKMNRTVKQRNVTPDKLYHWPNGVVPYEISSGFDEADQKLIISGLEYVASRTCIKPTPRSKNDTYGVVFSEQRGHGCASVVGFWDMTQYIYLDKALGCVTLGTIVHEFLHSLGFWHQQSAHDRDDYITIKWENISPQNVPNFNKANINTTSYGMTYDYGSIMHYSSYAFSINGAQTLVPKDPRARIGQREKLSEIDILKIKRAYNCPDANERLYFEKNP